jgi:hypothetical protein
MTPFPNARVGDVVNNWHSTSKKREVLQYGWAAKGKRYSAKNGSVEGLCHQSYSLHMLTFTTIIRAMNCPFTINI